MSESKPVSGVPWAELPATLEDWLPPGSPTLPVLDAATLAGKGRNYDLPFLVRLADGAGQYCFIRCVRLIRVLPGKRLVAVAELADEEVLLKLFFGPRAGRRMQRELAGLRRLQKLQVPTSGFRGAFTSGDGVHALALEYYPGALNLRQAWRAAGTLRDRLDLLFRAVALLADMHEKGMLQQDVHLGNWLLTGGRLLAIDGDRIVGGRAAPALAACMGNLADFHAQLPPSEDQLLKLSWPAYRLARGWPEDGGQEAPRLEKLVMQARRKRIELLKKKSLRDSTRHVAERGWRSSFTANRSELVTVRSLYQHPDRLFEDATPFKESRSSTLARCSWGGADLMVKRYHIKGPGSWLQLCFRASRARRNWQNAQLLEELGIRTFRPGFFLERRLGPLPARSYLVYPFVASRDALTALRRASGARRTALIQSLVGLLLRLREGMVCHGDLKASSILMTADGPLLLDLDAVRLHANPRRFAAAFRKDLLRFLQNFNACPGLPEELRAALAAAGLLPPDAPAPTALLPGPKTRTTAADAGAPRGKGRGKQGS